MRLIKGRVQIYGDSIRENGVPYFLGGKMEVGHFYYLEDQYFIDFSDPMLMKNKEVVDGQAHDRPCYYTFQDTKTNLYWMIPISSKVEKYSVIYDRKINKYGKCDTIAFGEVLGHKKAFLIQNMCPIIPKYVKNEYIDKEDSNPVRVNSLFEKELISKAERVLALQRKGFNLIFPDVLKIEQTLFLEERKNISLK